MIQRCLNYNYIFAVMLSEKLYAPVCAENVSPDLAVEEYLRLVKIYNFIQLSGDMITEERLNSALFRVHYATALEGIDYTFEHVRDIVNHTKEPLEIFEQEIYGYHQAELFLFNRVDKPLDVYMINDMQRLFFAFPGGTKTLDLFTSQIYEFRGVDLSKIYESGLASFAEWLEADEQFHPLIQAFMLHGFLLAQGPFGAANAKIARILQFYWLMKHNMTLGGLLITEKDIYATRNQYLREQELLKKAFSVDPSGHTHIDFSSFVQYQLDIYTQNLNYLSERLRNHFRNRAGFDKLSAPLKNVVNYLFECGSELTPALPENMNERQTMVLRELYRNGIVQTKDLFDKYEVNRKTIQRDFAEFEEMGLVVVSGEGRGLKYTVPVQGAFPEKLRKFQFQIS